MKIKAGDIVKIKLEELLGDNKHELGQVETRKGSSVKEAADFLGLYFKVLSATDGLLHLKSTNGCITRKEMVELVTSDVDLEKEVTGKPDHYASQKIDVYEFCLANELGMLEGNVVKYVTRRKDNRLEDLKKAKQTIERLIQHEQDVPR
jgi:hypothetical protein